MTGLLIEDTRRRLRTQRAVLCGLLGVTVAGYVDPTAAFFALTVNAIIWFVWVVGTSATLRELRDIARDTARRQGSKESKSA